MGTASPATGRPYPTTLVCQVLEVPRSTLYGRLRREAAPERPATKRGPKTRLSDDELTAKIRTVIETSPFVGEGHRKVRARLAAGDVFAGKGRVLRLMREADLLSPARSPARPKRAHDGRIMTDAPNEMWGTDAWRFETDEEGLCWGFVAVDHFNTEVKGWHVCKIGNRFAALEPIRQGVEGTFADLHEGVAAGLSLRMDHGSQYTSRDFRGEIRFFGIDASYAFVAEPQCNGVAESFIGRLKEQCVWLHRFKNLEEARQIIGEYIKRHNTEWLVAKHDHITPIEARERWERDTQSHVA